MNNIKSGLRIMLTFASMIGFLGGWATLAHSRKPVQNTPAGDPVVEALPTLAPLTPINVSGTSSDNGNGSLTIIAPPVRVRPSRSFFSSGGS